ncbi:MAG TPA: hypothetical protein VKC63_04835 [Solirubrobacterales bacterium]|nr:hypothetical protein [Solirubrobacterales bacterium]
MSSKVEQKQNKKLKVRVNYGGREHPFHPEPEELAGALREEAMDFFGIVADREQLRLYRSDNSELADGTALGAYDLAKDEVLILRQPQGGGRC